MPGSGCWRPRRQRLSPARPPCQPRGALWDAGGRGAPGRRAVGTGRCVPALLGIARSGLKPRFPLCGCSRTLRQQRGVREASAPFFPLAYPHFFFSPFSLFFSRAGRERPPPPRADLRGLTAGRGVRETFRLVLRDVF